MDSAKSTPRAATSTVTDEGKDPVRAQAIDSGIPRKMNATVGASGKDPVDARVDSSKRSKPTPQGPRPLETASRRLPTDAPTTPRRSQLPNTTAEPFLGLSARKRPAASISSQAALVTHNREVDRRRRTTVLSSKPIANGAATVSLNTRAGLEDQLMPPMIGALSNASRDVVSPSQLPGLHVSPPLQQNDPALRAAQLSTASLSGLITAPPLNIRSRRQTRNPSAASNLSEDPLIARMAQQDLTIATSAAKDSVSNATRRALLTKSPALTFGNGQRVNSITRLVDQSDTNGNLVLRRDTTDLSSQVSTPQLSRRIKASSPDPPSTPQTDPTLRTTGSLKPILVDVSTPLSGKRQSVALAHNGGMLARTVSPTDVRKTKRVPDNAQSSSLNVGSPTPEATPRERASVSSPPLSRRRSSSPSSVRGTPELQQAFGPDLSVSSQSSYNSLRPSILAAPVSRNSSIRSRATLSSAGGEPVERVPPVPAIPKAYGSSRNVSEEQQYSRYEDPALQNLPSPREPALGDRATAVVDFQPSVLASSSQDTRYWKSPTFGSGPDGTNQQSTDNNNARQASQPIRLPPLNLLPISDPIAAKIEAMNNRQQRTQPGRTTPPALFSTNRTPTTPMTVPRTTFSNNDLRVGMFPGPLPTVRDRLAHDPPGAASSRGSSPAVFHTPSPTASPAPNSDGESTPLPLISDAEEQSIREQKRNEMLGSKRMLAEAKSPETLDYQTAPYGRSVPAKPLSTISSMTATSSSSAGHRNFSQKLQQLRDEMSLQKQDIVDSPSTTTPSGLRRAISLGRVKQSPTDDENVSDASKHLRPAASSDRDALKAQAAAHMKPGQNSTESTSSTPGPTAPPVKTTGVLPPPSQKSSSSRDSRTSGKLQEGDALFDVDAFAADEEMRKLAVSRKDFEAAAKELDELRRKTSSKERMSPSQALRTENLNIFERGEIIDYKDIYFCGLKTAKKFIGDLSTQAANFGFDDERGDYNLVVGDHLAYRYEVLDLLGKGSFGQVVRCIDHKTGGLVAVKIIRNKKRFHQQALVEVNILRQLKEWDPLARNSMINFTQSFYFRGHLCISTELLGMNLYEFIKAYDFRGFSLRLIRRFTKQLLSSLCLLQSHKVIHCDMKPENILLAHPLHSEIKVIDFGSSCFENEKVYTYIQSRFYRSPEVILGMEYGMPIDMWSLGCILAELYTGYPIFPGENEQEQLACIMEIFGPPEKHLIEQCSRKKLFFDSMGKPRVTVSSKGKRRRPSSKTLQTALKCDDEAFLDFLSRCLRWDPARRLKPDEAMRHEFLVGIKKRTHTPVLRAISSTTPAKRYTIQTPARTRVIGDTASTSVKTGAIGINAGSSPIKTAHQVRRESTVSGLAPASQAASKARNISSVVGGSALPRAVPRSTSGKPDLAASAAALASIVSR